LQTAHAVQLCGNKLSHQKKSGKLFFVNCSIFFGADGASAPARSSIPSFAGDQTAPNGLKSQLINAKTQRGRARSLQCNTAESSQPARIQGRGIYSASTPDGSSVPGAFH
jgi:hypothetical protein